MNSEGSLTLHDLYCQEAMNHLADEERHRLIQKLILVHGDQAVTADKKHYLKDFSFDIGLVKLLRSDYPTEAARVLARFMMAGLYPRNFNRLIIQLVTTLPERIEDLILKIRCYNWLGLAYDNLGQYAKAISLFEQARSLLGDNYEVFHQGYVDATLGNLAQTQTTVGDYRYAVHLHIISLRNRIKRNDIDDIVVSLTWLGEAFEGMRRFRWAKQCYFRAKKLYESVPETILNTVDKHFEIYRMLGLARVYQRENKLQASEKCFGGALGLAQKLVDNGATADILLQRSKFLPHLESRRMDLIQAEELYRNAGKIRGEIEVLQMLRLFSDHQGRAQSRLAFLESLN